MARTPVNQGFPEHGDPHEETPEGEVENQEPEAPAAPAAPDPLLAINQKLDTLTRENAELRRMIPPATPKTPTASEEPEVDFEKLLFADPKKALQIHGEQIARKVTTELRAEYQRDRGQGEFWNRFYGAHPDLRGDSDLVELVLNSNLPTLANIPVEDAYSKLAELTRDRILRYAGGTRKPRKPQAEGSGGHRTPNPNPEPPAPAPVISLSDVLRGRRQGRRKAGAA